MFDFDTPISRRGTHAEKYTARKRLYGREDVLPFWVADMEFAAAPSIINALAERVHHPVYGYTSIPESLLAAVVSWNKRRYGVRIAPEAVTFIPGVMAGVSAALMALSGPGETVVLQTPLYPPLMHTVRKNDRLLVENSLVIENGRYAMNFRELEHLFQQHRPKIFILCSPHNPVGRVWSREELSRLAELTGRYGVHLVSDEIHADIVFPPHQHVPALSLDPGVQSKTIVLHSASKSFNIAGLQTAYALIPDPEFRAAFRRQLRRMNLHGANLFGLTALEAAYIEGEPWLEALLDYLSGSRQFMADILGRELPGLRHYIPEGSYLAWLDFNSLGFTGPEIRDRLINMAGVGLNDGLTFSPRHEGFWRFNFAAPLAMLKEGLERIISAFR